MDERGGLVGLHIKGTLTGKLFAISRKQLTMVGACKARETSKHHKIQTAEGQNVPGHQGAFERL